MKLQQGDTLLSRHPHCLDFPPFWSGQGKFSYAFNPSMEEGVCGRCYEQLGLAKRGVAWGRWKIPLTLTALGQEEALGASWRCEGRSKMERGRPGSQRYYSPQTW